MFVLADMGPLLAALDSVASAVEGETTGMAPWVVWGFRDGMAAQPGDRPDRVDSSTNREHEAKTAAWTAGFAAAEELRTASRQPMTECPHCRAKITRHALTTCPNCNGPWNPIVVDSPCPAPSDGRFEGEF